MQDHNITQAFFTLDTISYQLLSVKLRTNNKQTQVYPQQTPDLLATISFGAEWVNCLAHWPEVYTYIVYYNNEFTHIKFLNSDWYHIKPTEHNGKLYWHTFTASQINTLNPLHPTHFICKVPRAPFPSSSDSSDKPQVFPDLDKLKPRNTSPGNELVADLQQAPIFADITEPTDQDQKGKS